MTRTLENLIISLIVILVFGVFGVIVYFTIAANKDVSTTTIPSFIHQSNASCKMVVGDDGSETKVYLCRDDNDDYFYVKTIPATIGTHPFEEYDPNE